MSKKVSHKRRDQLNLLDSLTTADNSGWRRPKSVTSEDHFSPARITPVYDIYWYFAAERQNVFFNRIDRINGPWTDDPILSEFKFTNAYRAADRVSQYLIRRVIYRDDLPDSPDEILFRIILFKLFNKIETWELLESRFGQITFAEYDFNEYDRVLQDAQKRGERIYSAAYIMHPGKTAFGLNKKHQNHLKLVEQMMSCSLGSRLTDTKKMQEGYEILRTFPIIGSFLGYQLITDINYSELTNYSEMEFVVPGPGALDGIRKCFSDLGGLNEEEIIRFVTEIQNTEFERLGYSFQNLWGRDLQLIDCQNLFCEISKYSRVSHPDIVGTSNRTRIKQKFGANMRPIEYWFPPKWGISME